MLESAVKVNENRDVEQIEQVKELLPVSMHSVKDWLSELISKILQPSGDLGALLQQIETSMHNVLGPACQGIHFMVLDDGLADTLARASEGSQRLKFRKITIGAAAVTLLVLKRSKKSQAHLQSINTTEQLKAQRH